MKRFLALICMLLVACAPQQAADTDHEVPDMGQQGLRNVDLFGEGMNITTRDVEYSPGSTGFYAEPTEQGDYPGIVMIHEWWGLNENIKDMARHLAGKGYSVLAVDLYEGNVATTSVGARALVGKVNQEQANLNMQRAANYLRDQGAERMASLGWCFGGKQSLQLSLTEPMDATVIYYGNLVTEPTQLQSLQGPVLGIFGEEDGSIPVEAVRTFEQGLNEVEVENSIHVYEGVGHAFANPSGERFAPEATQDAWEKTIAFLDETLK